MHLFLLEECPCPMNRYQAERPASVQKRLPSPRSSRRQIFFAQRAGGVGCRLLFRPSIPQSLFGFPWLRFQPSPKRAKRALSTLVSRGGVVSS
uniref:Uncharacterized protein n=1 Tax=uncultured marine virus TaxID=186617 RepID=A0A0F7L5N7_9VIRU|nr:hypothetical protein [uncultured marine virus]